MHIVKGYIWILFICVFGSISCNPFNPTRKVKSLIFNNETKLYFQNKIIDDDTLIYNVGELMQDYSLGDEQLNIALPLLSADNDSLQQYKYTFYRQVNLKVEGRNDIYFLVDLNIQTGLPVVVSVQLGEGITMLYKFRPDGSPDQYFYQTFTIKQDGEFVSYDVLSTEKVNLIDTVEQSTNGEYLTNALRLRTLVQQLFKKQLARKGIQAPVINYDKVSLTALINSVIQQQKELRSLSLVEMKIKLLNRSGTKYYHIDWMDKVTGTPLSYPKLNTFINTIMYKEMKVSEAQVAGLTIDFEKSIIFQVKFGSIQN